MKLLVENHNRLTSSLLVSELVKLGATNYYVSPGMRNAPLLSALKNNSKAKIYLGIDERAQAYRAMGSSKASGRPSVLVCTSGTALLNYSPAIAEAKKSGSSIIILSADRPDELVWSNANQTMEQNDVFKHLNIPFWKLPTTDENFPLKDFLHRVDRMIETCKTGTPIHFNIPFREPLDGTDTSLPSKRIEEAKQLFASEKPLTSFVKNLVPTISESEIKFFNKRGLLVVGELSPNTNKMPLNQLIQKMNWPVLLDVLSGHKYSFSMKDGIIPSFDHPEILDYFKNNKPEVIIHIGGRLTSKHYHQYLNDNQDIDVLHITPKVENNLSPHNANLVREASPDLWAEQLLTKIEKFPNNNDVDTKRWNDFVEKKRTLIENSKFCYPLISKTLVESLTSPCDLYLGNSTVIRSFDSFAGFESLGDIRTIGHRGVSGIEGFIAAVQGHRESSDHGPAVLVLGDISFLHDLNSLALLNENERPLMIIVVNNFGGGIFSLLPMEKGDEILPMMSTPHEIVFENVIKSFHLEYEKCTDNSQFKSAIESFKTKTTGVKVVELIIDNNSNTEVYKKLKTVRL
ncbi:MAG: 2-succinyl-5-enolpyruvyl-6-hydroxy-3-cyclohexene-1-carboxylic-acid synthase [Bacteriovoracaceae bacterium]|nr:2-succinyl-5-enolpyruvyl-6-hydroxy-3-cyclohexene-1-carboxylic-acid synthase [Bacteriovoracaceae bacterium]